MSLRDFIRFGRQVPSVARVEPSVSAAVASGTAKPDASVFEAGFTSAGRAVGRLPRVTPGLAEQHATVYAACNIVAGDLSKVPLVVHERKGDGREVPVYDHPLSYLLNVEAAPGVPAVVTRYALIYSFMLRGNGVAFGPRNGAGDLEMIDMIHGDHWQIYRQGRARFYDFQDGAEIRRRAPSRSIIHLRNGSLDGWMGRSPLQIAAATVGLAIAGQDAAARTATGITTKAVVKLDFDPYATEEERMAAARRIKATMRDQDADGMPVLGPDEDIKSLDLSAADQELLATRKFDREMIAAIYRVPPSKLQILEFGVKANGQQQALDYRTDCLLHWGGSAENQMGLALFTERERLQGLCVRHDYSGLLEPTTQEHYSALNTAVGGPFMTANEARARARLQGDVQGGEKLNPAPNMTRDDSAPIEEGETDDDD